MGKKLLPPYVGSNRKKCDICVLKKKHTQMRHLNESQRYTIYRMRKDKKNTIRDSSLHRSIASYCQQGA